MIDTMDKHSCELFLEDALEIGRRLVETGAGKEKRAICIHLTAGSGTVRRMKREIFLWWES